MMREIEIPGTDLRTSCIGMGCASLGSRISKTQGLRALNKAYERGVIWYDVAPAYGAGNAEEILGEFLVGNRANVSVCSKVGLAPPERNDLIKFVYTVGRPIAGVAKGLRHRFRRMPATRNVRIPLSASMIEDSVVQSLKRLKTDYLDVFALHDPLPVDLLRDDILRALENVYIRGQARYLAVAGTNTAAMTAASVTDLFRLFQLADDPIDRPLVTLREQLPRPAGFISHSVLGLHGARSQLVARLRANPRLLNTLRDTGYSGSVDRIATHLLMRRAFASNSNGVVLTSMFSGSHLEENVGFASAPLDPAAIDFLDKIYAS